MKTEKKWTPEPWKVKPSHAAKEDCIHILADNKDYPATVCEVYDDNLKSTYPLATAQRIVACVNGCAGIADPSVVKDLLGAAKDAEKMIMRDVCALEDSGLRVSADAAYDSRVLVAIRAAIAKAEGR